MSAIGSSDKHYELAVGIATEALKALLLLNGGAATALIALSSQAGRDFTSAIVAFGIGAFCAVVAFVVGYFSQLSYGKSVAAYETNRPDEARIFHRNHRVIQIIAIVFILGALFAGGGGVAAAYNETRSTSQKSFYTSPSRAEVFSLRAQCAALGQKLLDADLHGPAIYVEQISRYLPDTNRCYVDLEASPSDLTKTDGTYSKTIYDGQTGEILAWWRSEGSRINPKMTCYIGLAEQSLFGSYKDCNEASEKILDFMSDTRQR